MTPYSHVLIDSQEVLSQELPLTLLLDPNVPEAVKPIMNHELHYFSLTVSEPGWMKFFVLSSTSLSFAYRV